MTMFSEEWAREMASRETNAEVERLEEDAARLNRENVLLKQNIATLNAIIEKMYRQLYPDG